MKKKLDQYSGPLTPAEIVEGINISKRNAKRLAEDAKLLFDLGRYPSSAALSVLAIEESGKAHILRILAVAKNDEEIREAWKNFRSHTKKNVHWLLPQVLEKGARKLEDFRPLFDRESEHPFLLDQIKQISFYTDCLGKKHWSYPDKVIDAETAEILLKNAQTLSSWKQVSIREIELWIKHMKPVWKNKEWMKKALENWYSEMQSEGLKPEGENIMAGFIRHGIGSDKGEKESGGK